MSDVKQKPRVYLAVKLTNLEEDRRREVETDCDTICSSVVEASHGEWSVYSPLHWTAPWEHPRTPADIWTINTREVLVDADALILHGVNGGSNGTGHELAMAFGRSLPVLYVHHHSVTVSRQVVGMQEHAHSFDIKCFSSGADLSTIVRSWIGEHRDTIEARTRIHELETERWLPVQQMLKEAWRLCKGTDDKESLQERVAIAGMPVNQLNHVLSHPLFVAALPSGQLARLAAALGVPLGPHFTALNAPPPLDPKEAEALEVFRRRAGLGRDFTKMLEGQARLWKAERDPSALHRLGMNLEEAQGWDTFYRAFRDGTL